MAIDLLSTDRLPVLKLHALNEDGSLLLDLTPFLESSRLTFSDEMVSHEATFVIVNSTNTQTGYFDKYGDRAGANVLVENTLIQFWKGFLDPTAGFAPTYYPAFVGRIVEAQPTYSLSTNKAVIVVTAYDLLKLSLERKFTSDPFYNTQINQTAQILLNKYGDPALPLFGTNLYPLDYLQGTFQSSDMTLTDCLADLYNVPIYQFWTNYAGQPETFPKLGSTGLPVLGYPDAVSPPIGNANRVVVNVDVSTNTGTDSGIVLSPGQGFTLTVTNNNGDATLYGTTDNFTCYPEGCYPGPSFPPFTPPHVYEPAAVVPPPQTGGYVPALSPQCLAIFILPDGDTPSFPITSSYVIQGDRSLTIQGNDSRLPPAGGRIWLQQNDGINQSFDNSGTWTCTFTYGIDFTFPDGSILGEIEHRWQDHTFSNQIQVRGIALAQSTELGPSQLLAFEGTLQEPNFLSAGKGITPRLFYTQQTGNQNALSAQNVFLKVWDPSFNNLGVTSSPGPGPNSGHLSAGPYCYIASGPGITNDQGQLIPFPTSNNRTSFTDQQQRVFSIKSDGTQEGAITVKPNQLDTSGNPLSPLPPWPPNFVDLFLWANSDGGGFEWFVQVYGQPTLTENKTLTSIADYNSQNLTEVLSDIFGDHATYQGTKVPWGMGTPVQVIVNPNSMVSSTLANGYFSGSSIIEVSSSGSDFLPPTNPSIYQPVPPFAAQTPAPNVIAIGSVAGGDLEFAIVKGVSGNFLTLSSPLSFNHLAAETVQGLTAVISYDDIYQSLVVKGDWDRGRIVFTNQTFRPFSADEFSSNSPGPSSSQKTFSTPVVDTSVVISPAPQQVYQSYRQGVTAVGSLQGFTYTFSNLTIGYGYTFRLHFTDDTSTRVGQRVFDIYVNGAAQVTSFDIFAQAGGNGRAFIQEINGVNAEPDGTVTLTFQNQTGVNGGADRPIICGIEVVLPQGQGGVAYAVNCGNGAVGPSPSTTSTTSITAGGNSVTLTSIPSGLVAGSQFQIDDNLGTLNTGGPGYSITSAEDATVFSVVGLVVTIVGTFEFNHSSGVNVYLLPTIQATYGWSPNQQIYGTQALVIDDPLLQTLSQCQNRANFEVNKAAWQRNQANLVTASVPTIKPGWLVKWFNPVVSANGSDFWGYVQSVERNSDISDPNNPVDLDAYSTYILFVRAR